MAAPAEREPDLIGLAGTLKAQADKVITLTRAVMTNPHLADDPDVLKSFAEALLALEGPSKEASEVSC